MSLSWYHLEVGTAGRPDRECTRFSNVSLFIKVSVMYMHSGHGNRNGNLVTLVENEPTLIAMSERLNV